MPLYTFVCPEHGQWDSRESYDTEVIHCVCGRASGRVSVYRVNFGGYASTPMGQQDYRDSYRRFTEASETLADRMETVERNTGREYNSPLFAAGMDKAAELASKGVTADTFRPESDL